MGAFQVIPLLNRGGEPSYLRSSHDPPATSHRGGCQSRASRNPPRSVPAVEKSAESRAWVRACIFIRDVRKPIPMGIGVSGRPLRPTCYELDPRLRGGDDARGRPAFRPCRHLELFAGALVRCRSALAERSNSWTEWSHEVGFMGEYDHAPPPILRTLGSLSVKSSLVSAGTLTCWPWWQPGQPYQFLRLPLSRSPRLCRDLRSRRSAL
jgi:hypothetical protein